MINIEENLCYYEPYNSQKDWIVRGGGYVLICPLILEFLRNQIPEVELLQLVPGVLFLLLLLCLAILTYFSSVILFFPLNYDMRGEGGVKNVTGTSLVLTIQFVLFFFFAVTVFNYSFLIPISLDYFESSAQKGVEELWSLFQVLSFQTIFLNQLIFFSQLPVLGQLYFATEKDINAFPEFWREVAFFFIFLSGFLTPTLDGSTQLAFFSAIFGLYISFVTVLKKRANLKNQGTAFFGS